MAWEQSQEMGLSASERRILEVILRRGPISRTRLAEEAALGQASVSRLIQDLETRGLVRDEVLRAGLRGQPSRPLSLDPTGGYALGVNFSHSFMDVGIVDLAGCLVSKERVALAVANPQVIGQAAREAMERQLAATDVPPERLVGAGFSLPGDFGETPAFLQAHAYFPELLDHDLAAALQPYMPIKVFVENDALSAAIGEYINGAARRLRSVLFVHIGHGVGGGLILDGRPFSGAHRNAGALGVIYPLSEPRPSGQDLLETLLAAGVTARDFDDLEPLYPQTCPPLRRWLLRAADQLSSGLHTAARILDPEAVIIGGRLPPGLTDTLVSAIDVDAMFARSRNLPRPALIASSLGSYAGVIGAASVCMFQTFFSPLV